MKKILIFCLTLSFILNVSSQTTISEKSEIKFHISGGGLFKVKGSIKGMQGDFLFDKDDLKNSKFDICISVATINTNNKKRDEHLLKEDFFNVAKYPNICFESKAIMKSENGFLSLGNLKMLGVTKEVEIPFQFKNNSFEGQFVVNRLDYGLARDYGSFKVGKEAKITIVCLVN